MEGVADSAVFGVPSLTSTAVCTAVAVCVARVRACDDASNSSMEGVPFALSRSQQGRGWTFSVHDVGGHLLLERSKTAGDLLHVYEGCIPVGFAVACV